MAKERMINTRIWNDNWVSKLDPIEKLLFVYFLSNEHTNISGIYELPLKIAAIETGIDPSMLEKMMPRLFPKVLHFEGWIICTKFPKYQNLKSKDVILGVQREFSVAPIIVQNEAILGGWGDGLGIVPTSPRIPNLTKPNFITADAENEETSSEAVDDNGDPLQPRYKKKAKDDNSEIIRKEIETLMGHNFVSPIKEQGLIRKMLDTGYTKAEIVEEWQYQSKKHWKIKKGQGITLSDVANSIHIEHD